MKEIQTWQSYALARQYWPKDVIFLDYMSDGLKSRKNALLLALLFLVLIIGVLVAYKLYRIDYELWGGKREAPSFCNVSEFVNCDAVSMSEYSSIYGMPLSIIGASFYLGFLLLVIIALFFKERSRSFFLGLTYLFGILSSVEAVIFAFISITMVKALCILCFASYLVNFSILGLCWGITGQNPITAAVSFFKELLNYFASLFKGSRSERTGALGVTAVLLITGGLISGLMAYGYKHFDRITNFSRLDEKRVIEEFYLKIPVEEVYFAQTSSSWGKKGANVKIVEFSDFKCPFCAKAAFLLKNLVQQYKDQVELVFKNYPMDSSCNSAVSRALHPHACLMTKAVLCSDKEDKFWRFHDVLFENAKGIGRERILELAAKEGMDISKFESCLESRETQRILEIELDEAKQINLQATPTIIINGRKIVGLMPPRVIQLILKYELGDH